MSHFNFDGNQGRVVVSGYKGITEGDERSISFWLRTTQENLATICYWGDDFTQPAINTGEECRIRLIGGKVELFGNGSFIQTSGTVNDGNFHHIAFTWSRIGANLGHEDLAIANVYVDNVLSNGRVRGGSRRLLQDDGTEVSPIEVDTSNETDVIIGARPDGQGGFTEFYSGDLDEFAIYKDVMSTATISGAYNSGIRGADLLSLGQVPSLQLWYRMGDDPRDTVPSGTLLATGTVADQQSFYSRDGITSSGVTISG